MNGRVTATEEVFHWESLDGSQQFKISAHNEVLVITAEDKALGTSSCVTLATTSARALKAWFNVRP